MKHAEEILAFLDEAHRFAGDALTKYVHKISPFQMDFSVDDTFIFVQKIDIIRKLINEETR